ncbi:MAG TPA: DUF4013 domain-containing protein [Anaerolineales bacterium]|nr:DUF4013 domain-containing protein [Anaerolineales bacterium]
MNIEKSFTFPFEDKEWISKLGLGAVIGLVPILNFAWSGYMVGIIRNVMNNVTEPLPTWDDLGKKFNDGLILFGAGLVYALPLLIVVCLPMGFLAVSGLLSGNSNFEDIARTVGQAGGVLFSCLLCVFVLYALALSMIYPAILVMFSREGTFASCFKLQEAFNLISKNAAPFFTAWGLSLAAGLGVGLVIGVLNLFVGWIPCLGWIASLVLSLGSGVYITAVYAHLFGQFGTAAFGLLQPPPASPSLQEPT